MRSFRPFLLLAPLALLLACLPACSEADAQIAHGRTTSGHSAQAVGFGANLAAGGFKITGLGAGSAAGDSIRWEQAGLPVYGGSNLAADVIGAATRYLSGPGETTVNSSAVALGVVTHSGIVRNLTCNLKVAPGGADTGIFHIQKSTGGGAFANFGTDITVTISAAGVGPVQDTTHQPAVVAGDILAIQVISSAGTAAGPSCGFEVL